jgi:hypothetical protein
MVTGLGLGAVVGGTVALGLSVTVERAISGLAAALLAGTGAAAVLLGACAATPAAVGLLGPLGRRLPGGWRLATRSLVRRRAVSSSLVSAVLAAAALAVGAATLTSAAVPREASEYRIGPEASWRADQVIVSGDSWRLGDNDRVVPTAPPAAVLDAVQAEIPATTVHWLNVLSPPAGQHVVEAGPQSWAGTPQPWGANGPIRQTCCPSLVLAARPDRPALVLADTGTRDALGLDAEARQRLDEVGALAIGGAPGVARLAVVPLTSRLAEAPSGTFDVAVLSPGDGRRFDGILVTPAVAARLGWRAEPSVAMLTAARTLTDDERAAATEAVGEATTALGAASDGSFTDPDDPGRRRGVAIATGWTPATVTVTGPSPWLDLLPVAGALAFTLFVVAVGLGLSAVETRDERDLLAVAGAPPRTLQALSARKAYLMVLLGTALAVPVGFVPTVVIWRASLSGGTEKQTGESVAEPVHGALWLFPTRAVIVLVILVPVVAALVTWVGSAVALRVRPLRISTMAWD